MGQLVSEPPINHSRPYIMILKQPWPVPRAGSVRILLTDGPICGSRQGIEMLEHRVEVSLHGSDDVVCAVT
jgi:hypothetical protein